MSVYTRLCVHDREVLTVQHAGYLVCVCGGSVFTVSLDLRGTSPLLPPPNLTSKTASAATICSSMPSSQMIRSWSSTNAPNVILSLASAPGTAPSMSATIGAVGTVDEPVLTIDRAVVEGGARLCEVGCASRAGGT